MGGHTTNQMITKGGKKWTVKNNMWGRVENMCGLWARGPRASAASKHWGGGAGGGTTRVVREFCHQRLKIHRRSRSTLGKRGMWPRDPLAPSQRISVPLGFRPGVAVIIEFRHRQRGLGECARACNDVARSGVEPRGVRTAKTMFEKYLNGGRHGPPLPMGQ